MLCTQVTSTHVIIALKCSLFHCCVQMPEYPVKIWLLNACVRCLRRLEFWLWMTGKVWPYPCLYTSSLEIACLSAAEEHVLFKFTSGFRNCRSDNDRYLRSFTFISKYTTCTRMWQGTPVSKRWRQGPDLSSLRTRSPTWLLVQMVVSCQSFYKSCLVVDYLPCRYLTVAGVH